MLSRKIFENLHAVMAICSAFLIILRQIFFKSFDPDSESFAKYDAFGAHIFDYACLRRKAVVFKLCVAAHPLKILNHTTPPLIL